MDSEGDRIRFLLANRPEWVAGALGDMGMDPFSARRYGRMSNSTADKAALEQEILQYMSDTASSRNERLVERGRNRARSQPAMRLPWDMNSPSAYEAIRGQ